MRKPASPSQPTILDGPLDPFLEALVLTGVHPELIMHQAEALGAGPERLLQIAGILTGPADPVPGMALALGSIRQWPALRCQALSLGSSLLTRLVRFFVFRKGAVFPCNQDGTKPGSPTMPGGTGSGSGPCSGLGIPGNASPANTSRPWKPSWSGPAPRPKRPPSRKDPT